MVSRLAARFVVVALALASGCAHDPAAAPPCVDPEAFKVVVQAGGRINPDDKGRALATVVRVYQLRRANKLGDATMDDITERGKEVLGDDLIAEEEMMLQPGETQ